MLTEALIALASAGGATLAAAMATDAWASAKAGFARLLGRNQALQVELVESRLERSRVQLKALSGQDLSHAQAAQAVAWRARLEDLLEDNPEAAYELQLLIRRIQAQLPAPLWESVQNNMFYSTGYAVKDGDLIVHYHTPRGSGGTG